MSTITIHPPASSVAIDAVVSTVAVSSTGTRGAAGVGWLSGAGAPSAVAPDGALYLDDVAGSYYKRIAGAWVLQGSLVGPAGGTQIDSLAGENVSALRAVRYEGASLVYCRPEEAASLSPIGISINAASIGGSVTVQTEGRLYDASWTWTVGQAVLVGADGALTQTQPVGQLWMISIGFAIAPNAMMVRVSAPILLSL